MIQRAYDFFRSRPALPVVGGYGFRTGICYFKRLPIASR